MNSLDNGLVHLKSCCSAVETMCVVERVVLARGMTIMGRIDHATEAAKVGLTMLPTELLLFGNPLSGTPVMIGAPTSSIDLPLKVLVWQDLDGQVWISYNSPLYLQQRHNIPQSVMGNLSGIKSICEEAAHSQTTEKINHT